MSRVFIDTSGWACVFDRRQPQHQKAVDEFQNMRQNRDTVVTSNYVIGELVSLLQSPLRVPRSQIIHIIDTIQSTPYIDVIHMEERTHNRAWNLYKTRLDKHWSLVDCASFVLMQEHDIQRSLTTDHHFEQAGFVRLLPSRPA